MIDRLHDGRRVIADGPWVAVILVGPARAISSSSVDYRMGTLTEGEQRRERSGRMCQR
jgi:hypothetical protein